MTGCGCGLSDKYEWSIYYPEPLNIPTIPLFSLECAPKITGKEYEILTDVNMLLDYENSVRGGIKRVIPHYAGRNK